MMFVRVVAVEKATFIHRRAPRGGFVHPQREYRGGQFIPAAAWQDERDKAQQALVPLLSEFGENIQFLRSVYEQQVALGNEGATKLPLIPLSTVEARLKSHVRAAYTSAFTLGKRASGNLSAVTAADMAAIKRLRIDEFRYLRNFLGDIQDGQGRLDYATRMDMYRAAARELYWLGFLLGNLDERRRIRWAVGPTEHCATCASLDGKVWTPEQYIDGPMRSGWLPQSGSLACLGYHCQCRLEEA